jgi:SH2 domain
MAEVVPLLQSILLSILIPEAVARKFWKGIVDDTSVSWKKFAPKLFAHLDSPLSEGALRAIHQGNDTPYGANFSLHCVKRLVSRDGVVRAERLGSIATCFGPFDDKFLRRVVHTMNQEYFFGVASASKANRLLCNMGRGTFLVRFSSSGLSFTISYVACGPDGTDEVRHVSIRRSSEGHSIDGHNSDDGRPFYRASLPDLMDLLFEKQKLKQKDNPAYQPPFRVACANWPFSSIFYKGARDGGYHANVDM